MDGLCQQVMTWEVTEDKKREEGKSTKEEEKEKIEKINEKKNMIKSKKK